MDRKRIQTAVHLKSKNWRGNEHCQLCGGLEDNDHIIFYCSNVVFVWIVIRDTINWGENSSSSESMVLLCENSYINGVKIPKKNMIVLFGAIAWSLWKMRNDLVLNNLVPFVF